MGIRKLIESALSTHVEGDVVNARYHKNIGKYETRRVADVRDHRGKVKSYLIPEGVDVDIGDRVSMRSLPGCLYTLDHKTPLHAVTKFESLGSNTTQ